MNAIDANAKLIGELHAGFKLLQAVAEAIREAGRVPSGTLYAALMAKLDKQAYDKLIDILKGANLIREQAHELIWIGPAFEGKAGL